jgi:hypothetical protein
MLPRGVYDGVSGVIEQPLKEIRAGGGVVGGFKGLAKGTIGFLPKIYVGTSSGITKVPLNQPALAMRWVGEGEDHLTRA